MFLIFFEDIADIFPMLQWNVKEQMQELKKKSHKKKKYHYKNTAVLIPDVHRKSLNVQSPEEQKAP